MSESIEIPANVKQTINSTGFHREIALSALQAYEQDSQLPNILEQEVFKHSTLRKMLEKQGSKNPNQPAIVLFSDIDGTFMIPHQWTTLERLPQYQAATKKVTTLCEEDNIPIAFTTGRDLKYVKYGQKGGIRYENERLPLAPLVLSSAATEPYVLQEDGSYLPDIVFEDQMIKPTGFERKKVYAAGIELVNKFTKETPDLNFTFQARDMPANVAAWEKDSDPQSKGLTDEEKPEKYKVTFHFVGQEADIQNIEQQMRKELINRGLGELKIVICFGGFANPEHTKIKYNIDIVPITKQEAVNYYAEKLRVLALTAGDSGNDGKMLLESGHVGIIVGGAKSELTAEVEKQFALVRSEGEIVPTPSSYTKLNLPGIFERLMIQEDPLSHKQGPETLLSALHKMQEIRDYVFGGHGPTP